MSPKSGAHGLFTLCLLEALDSRFSLADRNKDGILDLEELVAYVKRRMRGLPDVLDMGPIAQTPVVAPEELPSLPLVCASKQK
jgi:hypothetical protein